VTVNRLKVLLNSVDRGAFFVVMVSPVRGISHFLADGPAFA